MEVWKLIAGQQPQMGKKGSDSDTLHFEGGANPKRWRNGCGMREKKMSQA